METRTSDPREQPPAIPPEMNVASSALPGDVERLNGASSTLQGDVDRLLEHWLAVGVVTAEQAARMRADLPGAPPMAATPVATPPASPPSQPAPGPAPLVEPPVPHASLVTEALGYLGGVIILVASILVTARFWTDLGTPARLSLVGAAAVLLLVGGALVPQRLGDPGHRLRAVLWLAATGAVAGFLGLLGSASLSLQDSDLALFITGPSAVVAGLLWWAHHHPLQHVATLVAVLGTVASSASYLSTRDAGAIGLAVWGTGVVWALLAWGGLLAWAGRPSSANLGVVLGSAGAIFGAMATMPTRWGIVLALTTVAAVVVAAVVARSLVLLAVGSVAALQVLPATMVEWFGGTLGASLGLLLVGVLLVAAAIVTARRRRQRPPGEPAASRGPRLPWPDRTVAMVAAAVVAVSTSAAVLTLG